MADNTNDLSDLVVDSRSEDTSSDKKKKIILGVVAVVVIFLVVLGVMWQLNIGGFGDETKEDSLGALTADPVTINADPASETNTEVTELPTGDEEPLVDPVDEEVESEGIDEEVNEEEEELPEEEIGEEEEGGSIDEVINETKEVELKTKSTPEISEDLDGDDEETTEDEGEDESMEKAVQKAQLSRGYYIQVSANQRVKPSKSFIKKYKDNGYSVHSLKMSVDGVSTTKVLVGPYAKKSEANEILGEIKADRDDAFLYFVK